ncbi:MULTISPECIES: TetR/AcrR family transcriptional regulator [Actinomyces]|uniref:TetR/AcrR family transcriptional regulator n=1 Tax=Actinomyces respiraculi TaxID=2744574 RepID=A0A7T0PV98_9ACTO|nr:MULTISPECIES: TetR/AcrR family transcriptional regulator [Actinomyces]QPL04464.1 TetR/AcrR family transcriptional regulator [Actinomyces respiraculi]
MPARQRPGGGRPRDASLDERILAQTFALLAAKGLRGLRADEVARGSGVPKSTIYRRWPSLAELAVDAVDAALGPRECVAGPDPLADLTEIIVKAHTAFVSSPLAPALPQLAIELASHPEAATSYRQRVIAPLRSGAIAAVRRAQAIGQWPGPDPVTSVDMMLGTVAYRMNYLGHTADLEETFEVAEAVARRTLPRPARSEPDGEPGGAATARLP